MRRLAAALVFALLAACATDPAEAETTDAVCDDLYDLMVEVIEADVNDYPTIRANIEDLGIRAAGIDTAEGVRLMNAIASLAAGLDVGDERSVAEGLSDAAAVCAAHLS